MKLLRVEYTFDRNKIVFFFTAEGRVDFRELVKELAAVFHTRIEMRQVGVRDEAKQVSGIGPCGRTLCCASFLGEFAPVSIKMAKTQGLSLNPSKISGVCGRLMCCLQYEDGMYKCGEIKGKGCGCHKKIVVPEPSVGMKVMTDKGEGQVVYVNHQKHTVKVQYPDQPEQILSWKEIDKSDD
jgi:cell fate regulator YaaT (PSP1 superfamily)